MKIGTKSVFYGGHQFLIHPWFVAWAWWRLFGFPFDLRLWVAFFVHDLGYCGKQNMDGPEGETHVELGANIMHWLFDRPRTVIQEFFLGGEKYNRWYYFTLCHSRFYAKKLRMQPSRLCIADKLAICLTPRWLYLPLVRVTGEIREYMKMSAQKECDSPAKYAAMKLRIDSQKSWHADMCSYLRKWVEAHKSGCADTWTPECKQAATESGA